MSTVQEVEAAIPKSSRAEIEAIRDWIDDYLEDQLELAEDVDDKLEQSRAEIAAGQYTTRQPKENQCIHKLTVNWLDYRRRFGKTWIVECKLLIQGRCVEQEEITGLSQWIQEHGQWSRKHLARQLCERWQWRDERGRLKDFAARSLLLKLEAQKYIQLPPLQVHQRRAPRPRPRLMDWERPPDWSASLAQIRPVRVEPVSAGSPTARRWAFYLDQYHYLGLQVVGENLGYLAVDAHGREVAALLFGAPAWRCAPRDQFLGWDDQRRRPGLHHLANNTRFLIVPWVRVPHLASHVLSQVAHRIDADWRVKYGHGLEWLETFVERERFAGGCYRAAHWQRVGQTTGRSRQDRDHTRRVPVKDIYLYRLGRRRP